MTTWSSGYVADVEYTNDFYRELSPAYLNYVCISQGVRPPSLDNGATYCELGCGHGVGTVVIAAANPKMKVWGIDFNPAHIANARRLAQEGGVANVTFLDCSFEQALAEPAGTFPKFDYITLHGVYTWVSRENRRLVVEFIDRYLKPGGVVFVSYNCQPGWAEEEPLQRLFREHARRHPDRSDFQAKAGLAFSQKFAQAKAGYFEHIHAFGDRLNELVASNPNYLAHEFLNEDWAPVYHADVVGDFDAARLNFVGSATLIENNDRLSVPAAVIPIIQESHDPVWRETLRDYSRHQKFRRDIFMRGAPVMKPVDHSNSLAGVRVALLVDRASVPGSFKVPAGEIKASPDLYQPILDALAERPHTIGELAALPALRGKPGPRVVEAIHILVHFSQIHPVPHMPVGAGAEGRGFNRAVARRILVGDILSYVAVPAAGTGVLASYVELIAILAQEEGLPPEPRKVAEFAWPVMERTGQRMLKDKVKLEKREDNIAELEKHLEKVYARQLPVWKSLGVL